MSVLIYGASDDLIEVEGDVMTEFNVDDGVTYLAFSDGTVLAVSYQDDGTWLISRKAVGSASYTRMEAIDDDKNYSDQVTLDGVIHWVVAGKSFVRPVP